MTERAELPSLAAELDRKAASVNRPQAAKDAINDAFAAIEQAGVVPGIAIGERAPEFTLPDALGRPVRLADRLALGPVVLTFYRGGWCPYCNLELRAYQQALPAFRAAGATLIAISPQAPDDALSMQDKHSLEFDVLSDQEQQVIAAYRIRFEIPAEALAHFQDTTLTSLAKQQPGGHWSLPVPATFVIAPDRTVRARHVSMAYRTRMEPAEALRAVTEIAAAGTGSAGVAGAGGADAVEVANRGARAGRSA